MRKINYVFYTIALTLGIGVASCSSDNDITPFNEAEKDTDLTVSIGLPSSLATRGTTEEANTWNGRDKIEKLTLYIANESNKKVQIESFKADKISIANSKIEKKIKTTEGDVFVYAVLNDINGKITSVANTKTISTDLINFFTSGESNKIAAKAADVAATKGSKENGYYDLILMTNTTQPTKVTLTKGGTTTASVSINVERVTSKGILTVKEGLETSTIEFKNDEDQVISAIQITDISYGVGQGNSSFYPIKNTDLKTPNYLLDGSTFPKNTDNDGLAYANRVKALPLENSDMGALKTLLNTENNSKFVLPVTHETYYKGNTTFFDIRVKFKVTAGLNESDGTGGPTTRTDETPEDTKIYFGMSDHKFYTNRSVALGMGTAVEDANFKQQVQTFRNNEMVYLLWLNPDKIPGGESDIKTSKSPTVRNQIYRAHITGFKEMGLPYNPLDPLDPIDPIDPTTPPTPIDPKDPLETDNIYLNVDLSIIPWGLHSYETEVGNDY